jgi:hypothetical protein
MTDFRKTAEFLWDLLDDIDTASDIARSDDRGYRAMVEKIQRRRHEVASPDLAGRELIFK